MKVSVGQFCINVSDLERSAKFYSEVLGLEITQRIEIEGASEVLLRGPEGTTLQLAYQHGHRGPIDHGNAFWKLYLNTDDCKGLYERAIAAGCESVREPVRLEQWPVTMAYFKDPDGYQVEILESHAP